MMSRVDFDVRSGSMYMEEVVSTFHGNTEVWRSMYLAMMSGLSKAYMSVVIVILSPVMFCDFYLEEELDDLPCHEGHGYRTLHC
jgi:hypothetical protein